MKKNPQPRSRFELVICQWYAVMSQLLTFKIIRSISKLEQIFGAIPRKTPYNVCKFSLLFSFSYHNNRDLTKGIKLLADGSCGCGRRIGRLDPGRQGLFLHREDRSSKCPQSCQSVTCFSASDPDTPSFYHSISPSRPPHVPAPSIIVGLITQVWGIQMLPTLRSCRGWKKF